MATIIESIETRKRYVLLGSGYGMYQSKKPNWLFGELLADVDTGDAKVVCAANKDGDIVWLYAEKIQVISVDGQSPNDLLKGYD